MEKHKEETRDARGNRGEPDRVSTDHRRSVDRVARGVSSAAGLFCTVYEVSCGKPVIE